MFDSDELDKEYDALWNKRWDLKSKLASIESELTKVEARMIEIIDNFREKKDKEVSKT